MNEVSLGFLPAIHVRRLGAIPDDSMRRALIRETLSSISDDDMLALLGYLVCMTDADGAPQDSRKIYLDLVRELLGQPAWDAERMAKVDRYPAIASRRPVLAFLGMDPVSSKASGGKFGPWAMEDVSLGVRKSRARSSDPGTIIMLTADPEPSVIRILLGNPRITEAMILKVTARRPQKGAVFAVVIDSRFIMSETVQNSVVNNPWCPSRTAVALVPLLTRNHRAEVAMAGGLDESVRNAAAAMNAG